MNEDLFEPRQASSSPDVKKQRRPKHESTQNKLISSTNFRNFDDHDRLVASGRASQDSKPDSNVLRPSAAEIEQEKLRTKHKKKVLVTRQMVREAESLNLPLKEYLKLLDRQAKRDAATEQIRQQSIDHYKKSQKRH